MEQKIVKYSVLSPLAKVPAYATAGAAAADLCAALEEPLTIAPMQRVLVPTGLAIELPDAGCVALVYARSGLSIKHGLCMANGDTNAFGFGAACKPSAVPLKETAFKLHDAVDQAVVPLLPGFPYLNTPIPGAQ